MRVEQFDHLVLTVADVEASSRWYEQVLGMTHVVEGERHSLRFGGQKINLHQRDHTFEPKAASPTPGSADVCFVSASEVDEVAAHLRANGVAVEVGPVERTGALGAMTSLYVRDPDSNLVEIARYRPAQRG